MRMVGKKPFLFRLTKQVNDSLSVAVDQFYKHELSVEARNMNVLKDPDERKSLYFDLKDFE